MAKFIQVNRLVYDGGQNKYVLSPFDHLLNTDYITSITPRTLDSKIDHKFDGLPACSIVIDNGRDVYYVHGTLGDLKQKLGME